MTEIKSLATLGYFSGLFRKDVQGGRLMSIIAELSVIKFHMCHSVYMKHKLITSVEN